MFKLYFLLFLMAFAAPVWSASFNCARAATLIEQAVCHDQTLSSLDEKLMVAYIRELNKSIDKNRFRTGQLNWLKIKRNQCETADCLKKVYVTRLNQLNGASAKSDYPTPIRLPMEKSAAFTQNLPKLPEAKQIVEITPLNLEPIHAKPFEPSAEAESPKAQISDSRRSQSWQDDLIRRIENLPEGE